MVELIAANLLRQISTTQFTIFGTKRKIIFRCKKENGRDEV